MTEVRSCTRRLRGWMTADPVTWHQARSQSSTAQPHPAAARSWALFQPWTRGARLWTNPENTLLYVAHEQDELPGTPNAGQTVCSAFDVTDPFKPLFVAQIPLGDLVLPSGNLRNKKSINLVYVRPGARSQTA